MGVNVATVFSEFDDKEGLYAHALAKYGSQKLPLFIGALERHGADIATVLEVLRGFGCFADSGTVPGSLITHSTIEFDPHPRLSADALTRYVDRLQGAHLKARASSPSRRPTSSRLHPKRSGASCQTDFLRSQRVPAV